MNISDLVPESVGKFLNAVLDKAAALLEGETARAIGYGGGAVVFIVAKYVKAIPDVPLDAALLQAGIAVALVASLIEPIRHFVYSPATVAKLIYK